MSRRAPKRCVTPTSFSSDAVAPDKVLKICVTPTRSSPEAAAPTTKRTSKANVFDGSNRSNGVMIVEGKKFYIIKEFMANHSDVFEAMLFGRFKEAGADEVELKESKSKDFQALLELINGGNSLNDNSLEGILTIANKYLVKTAIERCKDFLKNNSQKSLKEKFGLASQYAFVELKAHFINKVSSTIELCSVMPTDLNELDQPTMKLFLEKCRELNKPFPPPVVRPEPVRPVTAHRSAPPRNQMYLDVLDQMMNHRHN